MIGKLCRSKPFGAQCPMGNRAIRITCNFRDFSIFDINDDPATAVAHATVALDHRIVAVHFHLALYIRISKPLHLCLLISKEDCAVAVTNSNPKAYFREVTGTFRWYVSLFFLAD
jgi:hypothetical protein